MSPRAEARPAPSPPGNERTARLEELRLSFSQLLAAERRFRARRQDQPGQLSLAQMRAITVLDMNGSATAGELAEASDLRPASVTAMLDHLEQDGLVRRERCAEDGRRVNVRLTEAGEALVQERRERWLRFGSDALAELPDSDLESAARAMRALAAGIAELE